MPATVVALGELSAVQLLFLALLGMFFLGWVLWGFELYRRAKRAAGRDEE
jgi:cbb3-type cytochrome oxidase subunit 3